MQEGERQRVKVLDFGIARPLNADMRLTQTGSFVGTPAYMAPEQMTGGMGDPRSDLYSLAAVAFEALSGRRVTPGDDLAQIFNDVLHAPRPRLSSQLEGVPVGVDEAFASAQAPAPARRPTANCSWEGSLLFDQEPFPREPSTLVPFPVCRARRLARCAFGMAKSPTCQDRKRDPQPDSRAAATTAPETSASTIR